MGRNCHGFQASLVLLSIAVNFCKDNPQSHSFIRAHILNGEVKFQYSSLGFQIYIPQIYHSKVLTSFHFKVYGAWAFLRGHRLLAVYSHIRFRENHLISIFIGIGNRSIHKFFPRGLAYMLNKELQGSSLISGNPQLRNFPLKCGGIYHLSGTFAGRIDAHDAEIWVHFLVNNNIKGPRF